MIEKAAKANQGQRNDICQKSGRSIDTKKELARIAGVSHDTIHKVETIENSGDEYVKEQARNSQKKPMIHIIKWRIMHETNQSV